MVCSKALRVCVSSKLAAFPVRWGQKSLNFPTMPLGSYSSEKYCRKAGRVELGMIALKPGQEMSSFSLTSDLSVCSLYVESLS
jgi:hypothetical protein